MTFEELLSLTKFVLNFNDGAADQDFSEARIKQAINLVYVEEVNRAKQEGLKRRLRASFNFTWAAGEVTLSVPPQLRGATLFGLRDITSGLPGGRIAFSEDGNAGDVFYVDRNTWQWGSQGPGSDRSLRAYYFARCETLVEDDDVPVLIPEDHQALLAWAAAIFLRTVADEAPPQMWLMKIQELRFDFWKEISRGQPLDDVPGIEAPLDTGEYFG
jgi:hypothetical protein